MKKLISFMNYDLNLLEREFEKKAECGYELSNLDTFFAYYKIINPKDLEFHICFNKKHNNQAFCFYLNEGWHIIKSKKRIIISKEKGCLTPKDITIINFVKKEQRKALWLNLCINLFLVFLILFFYVLGQNGATDFMQILYLLPSAISALLLFAIILFFEYKNTNNSWRKYIVCMLSGLLWAFIIAGIVLIIVI